MWASDTASEEFLSFFIIFEYASIIISINFKVASFVLDSQDCNGWSGLLLNDGFLLGVGEAIHLDVSSGTSQVCFTISAAAAVVRLLSLEGETIPRQVSSPNTDMQSR